MTSKLATSERENRSTTPFKTIPEWLLKGANNYGRAIAISSTDERSSLSYQALFEQTQTIATQLSSLGLKPGDIVALALENGSDFLSAILSVASVATALTLNPHQPQAEFERYFSRLDVKAVIVKSGSNSAICQVANSANIPILELNSDWKTPAGKFSLSSDCLLKKSSDVCEQVKPKLNDHAILVGTSGSTGQPKIISLTHESFFVSISHAADWMQLKKSDRSLVLTPLAMLHALVRSSCPLLLRGGEVICTPGYNPAKILDWLDKYRPSFFTGVPSIYRSLLQQIDKTNWIPKESSLRFLVTGSDKITPSEIQSVESVFNVPLIQFYGMSEVSPLPAVRSLPPEITPDGAIGKINPMWQVACLDEEKNVLPPAEEGEIVLRGGYINQLVGITKAKKTEGNDDWFHTGDLGYLDDAGFLYYTGRVDNRINRGGKKVYTGEVEAILLTHPAIEAAVAFGIEDRLYGECIGAVVVLQSDRSATSESIQQFMRERVAEFKVPDLILIEDALPLNQFGKVKRKTLADHYGLKDVHAYKRAAVNSRNKYIAPRTSVEVDLAQIWSSLLEVDSLSVEDNFFALGGHSLLATQMLSRIQTIFRVNLPMHRLFDLPTIAELALEIAQLQNQNPNESLFSKPTAAAKIPLSYNQKKYWLREQILDTQACYSMPRALEIEGALNIEAFQQSLQTIVRRHSVLRTVLSEEDGVVYQQFDEKAAIDLDLIDLQKISESKRKSTAYGFMRKEGQKPFKLTEDYLVRFFLLRLSATSYIFMVNMHHIISDGWSFQVFWRELTQNYSCLVENQPYPFEPLPIQYLDFMSWRQQYLQGAKIKKNREYWSKQLANMPTKLELPFDRTFSSKPTYARNQGTSLEIDFELVQKLKDFCQVRKITLYMMLLATWQLLLHYYSGQAEIVVMTPISGRDRLETEPLIGSFANLLLLSNQYDDELTFDDALVRVRQNCLDAYAHKHIFLHELVEQLNMGINLKNPLAQVLFSLDRFQQTNYKFNLKMSGLEVELGESIYTWLIMTDLQLAIVEPETDVLIANLFYNSSLFDESTANGIIANFNRLLNTAIDHPEQTIRELSLTSRLSQIAKLE